MATNRAFSLRKALATKAALAPLKLSLIALTIGYSSVSLAGQNHRIAQYAYNASAQVGPGNVSVIYQNGNDNRATVAQSYSAQYQNGNFSNIWQKGNANVASIRQVGGNNVGQILQLGNDNFASISQRNGYPKSEAFVTQMGQQSNITISQSGSGYRGISVQQQAFSGNTRPVTVETY